MIDAPTPDNDDRLARMRERHAAKSAAAPSPAPESREDTPGALVLDPPHPKMLAILPRAVRASMDRLKKATRDASETVRIDTVHLAVLLHMVPRLQAAVEIATEDVDVMWGFVHALRPDLPPPLGYDVVGRLPAALIMAMRDAAPAVAPDDTQSAAGAVDAPATPTESTE